MQGFPQMMDAEQYVVDHHLADVISQSFGSAEEAFGSPQSLENLRHAFKSAARNGVTVLGSSGDIGTAQHQEGAGRQGRLDDPRADGRVAGLRPARDRRRRHVPVHRSQQHDRRASSTTPTRRRSARTLAGQAEIVWARPDAASPPAAASATCSRGPAYQDALPAGSTAIPSSARGVPDIGLQASSRTGALVYITLPPDGSSGLICGSARAAPAGTTSAGRRCPRPQWAGLVAIAAQIDGRRARPDQPGAVQAGDRSGARYADDFFDITVGNNQVDAGHPAATTRTTGWDPITGLGTPNAANLLPDLAAASG